MALVDSGGRVADVNPAWRSMVGWPPPTGEALGAAFAAGTRQWAARQIDLVDRDGRFCGSLLAWSDADDRGPPGCCSLAEKAPDLAQSLGPSRAMRNAAKLVMGLPTNGRRFSFAGNPGRDARPRPGPCTRPATAAIGLCWKAHAATSTRPAWRICSFRVGDAAAGAGGVKQTCCSMKWETCPPKRNSCF